MNLITRLFTVLFLLFIQGADVGSTTTTRSLLVLKGSKNRKKNKKNRRHLGVGESNNRQTNNSKNGYTKTKSPTKSPRNVSTPAPSPVKNVPTTTLAPWHRQEPSSSTSSSLLPTPFPSLDHIISPTPTMITTTIPNDIIIIRTLVPFDIILGGTTSELVDDETSMKGSIEHFLYTRFGEEWEQLEAVQLEDSGRRRLLSQQFSYTGSVTFVDDMDGDSTSIGIVTTIPTTEEVHTAQRKALSMYLAELQAILNENGILLDIDDVQFGDDKDGNTGGVIGTIPEGTDKELEEDDDGSSSTTSTAAVTATWTTLVSAALMFTVGCILFKQGRSYWMLKYGSEQCIYGENSSMCLEAEGEEGDSDYSSSDPSHGMTWQVLLLRSSETVHQDVMDVEESSTPIKLITVPSLSKNEVVILKETPQRTNQ